MLEIHCNPEQLPIKGLFVFYIPFSACVSANIFHFNNDYHYYCLHLYRSLTLLSVSILRTPEMPLQNTMSFHSVLMCMNVNKGAGGDFPRLT